MTWTVMVNNGSLRSFTKCFYLQRWMFRFHDKNVFDNYLAHFLCLFQQRVSSFFHVQFQRWDPYQRVSPFFQKKHILCEKNKHRSPENGTFFFHLAQFSCHPWQLVSPFSQDLDLELVGRWKLPDSCPTSGRWACSEPNSLFHSCFRRSLVETEVTCTLSRTWLLQFPS